MMSKTVLGDIPSWHQLYLAASPSNVGVDVDGLACPLHHPMIKEGGTGGHVLKSCPSMPIIGWRSEGVVCSRD
jgi:hypothetical protein